MNTESYNHESLENVLQGGRVLWLHADSGAADTPSDLLRCPNMTESKEKKHPLSTWAGDHRGRGLVVSTARI